MNLVSDRELEAFQKAFSWFTGSRLPDGRILGSRAPKFVKQDDDIVVQTLKRHFDVSRESTLIEFGCAEGNLTVYMAPLVKSLVAVDVRPRNITGLLTRLYVHGIRNVEVWLKDISLVGPQWGTFDILVHAGVLYHLLNPVAHLFSMKDLANQLLLDTHYGIDALHFPPCAVEYGGKRYLGYIYREHGWEAPYGGIGPVSCWLPRDLILGLLHEIGYSKIEVVYDDPTYAATCTHCAPSGGFGTGKVVCEQIVTKMPRLIVAAKR
jgi:tRNA (mo5U34)-methyltransferase